MSWAAHVLRPRPVHLYLTVRSPYGVMQQGVLDHLPSHRAMSMVVHDHSLAMDLGQECYQNEKGI